MRYRMLALAATLMLGIAGAPATWAFETQVDDSTNADGSPKFADPDEQLDAAANGAGGASGFTFNLSDLAVTSGKSNDGESEHSVPWTPERIRLVFGPYAH